MRRWCCRTRRRGVYKKLVIRDNKVKGAVLYGDTMDGTWYFTLLREGTDISAFRSTILFGQHDLGDAGHGDASASVMALPASAEICGCNGVCKGDIVDAISGRAVHLEECARTPRHRVPAVHVPAWWRRFSPAPSVRVTTRRRARRACVAVRAQSRRGDCRNPKGKLKTMQAVRDALDWKTGRLRELSPGAELLPAGQLAGGYTKTMRSRVSSTSVRTATSRKTVPTRWCRACSAACAPPTICAPLRMCRTSTRSRR